MISRMLILILLFSIEIASQPNIEWEKTIPANDNGYGISVVQTIDGGYVVAGSIENDIYVLKTNSYGEVIWSNRYGGAGNEICKQIISTNDNGFAIIGYTNSLGNGQDDFLLIKIDGAGNFNWVKVYGESNSEYASSLCQTDDDGFILCGSTKSYGNGNFYIYVVKTNQVGDVEWTKHFGNGIYDFGRSVIKIENEEYIVAGETDSFGSGNIDIILMKLNSYGNLIWSSTYDISTYDFPHCLQQTYDKGFIIAGETNPGLIGLVDVLLVKTNSAGIKEWVKYYGSIKNDKATDIKVTSDSGFIVCGTTMEVNNSEDGLIIKTNLDGDSIWVKRFSELPNFPHPLHSITPTFDKGYIATGTSHTVNGLGVWLLKLTTDSTLLTSNEDYEAFLSDYNLFQNYPNPFNPTTKIEYQIPKREYVTLKVYDVLGNEVATLVNEEKPVGFYQLRWGAVNLPSGVYFYQLNSGDFVQTRKMLLLK